MAINKKTSFLFLLIIAPLLLLSQEYPDSEEILKIIQEEIANERTNSIVVGIIDDGREKYICHGYPIQGSSYQADEKTIYEIASVTKVFTSTVLANLISKGKLSLDDSMFDYLPDTIELNDEKGKKITIKHLATHTSGLPSRFTEIDLRKRGQYYANNSYGDIFSAMENYQFEYPAGTYYNYSNLNTALLAYIICKVTGKELESLYREIIFDPLQMKNTTLHISDEQKEYFATGYIRPGRSIKHWEWNAEAGAGGLRSSAQDLITFIRKLFYEDSPLYEAARLAITEQFDSTEYPNTAIGIGWFLTPGDNSFAVGHGGSTEGFTSVLMYDTISDRGVVVLSNSSRSVLDIGLYCMGLTDGINQFSFVQSDKLENMTFEMYQGQYLLSGEMLDTIDVYRKGNLYFLYSGTMGEFEMFYQGRNSFLIPELNDVIRFRKFKNNKAQKISMKYNKSIQGKRIVK